MNEKKEKLESDEAIAKSDLSSELYGFKNNLEPDYGYDSPKRTKRECKNPEFMDKHLHRVAIMKDEHWGAKGDRDENGVPGWTVKLVCNGCGRVFKKSGFFIEKKAV